MHMKKLYLAPNIKVFQITTKTLLMGSTLNSADTNPTVTVGSQQYEGPFASRSNELWGDREW